MITLKLDECALVSARPTTGKSVLAVNAENCFILDTDFITFDAMRDWLVPEDYDRFRADHNKFGTPANGCKTMMIEMIMQFFMQFEIPELVWITNLCPQAQLIERIKDRGKTVYVTRDPDDAWRVFKEREEERGQALRISEQEVKKWYTVPQWAFDLYDEVITLESDEYLCDVFGIVPEITEVDDVDEAMSRQSRETFVLPSKERKFSFL